MIYPNDFEAKIGFSSLRSLLVSKCESTLGRELAESFSFSSDFNYINRWLRQTYEMKCLISSVSDYPKPQYYDISGVLNRLKSEGSYADPSQLLNISKTLIAFRDVRKYFGKTSTESDKLLYPYLYEVFSPLTVFPDLCSLIDRSINKFGEVADNASEGLLMVRSKLAAAQNSVSKAIRRAMDKAVAAGIIDKDTSPAIREGRMVIPVSAGLKKSIEGIVHDESSSGKTVFIEPSEVVVVSNRVRQLQMEERREILAVLVEIADHIRPHIEDIQKSCRILGLLDFITAKAKLAVSTGGNLPILHENPEIDWYGAVHPILLISLKSQGREVVPLNLRLENNSRVLIVSGPNAGGKSVVLKTCGIIQYMTQCGLLPNVHDNSHVGIFNSIFVDIGDEQSLENDLSTYSSHLRNMKFFLTHADSCTLILADELGSGTEPQIGAALAQAIIKSIAESGCYGVITTHYQNLKTFAEEHDGFFNGAMVYDRQQLRPTFQLSVGHPGSSFALEIAKKIGLPREVIEDAKKIVGSEYVNIDKYLLDIERDRRYWNLKRQNIREKESKLNKLLEKYEDSSIDINQQRSKILSDAKKQADEILRNANARIEATIKEIRNIQAEKEQTKKIRKELAEYRDALKEDHSGSDFGPIKPLKHKSRSKNKQKKPALHSSSYVPAVGDFVKMDEGGVTGKILSIKDNKAEVAFGSLRTYVEISRLRSSSKPKEKASSQIMGISSATFEESRKRQLDFRQEIDVRGMRADEALQAVTYFIDDAIQFNAKRVRILHGTGHGILKTLIRQQLNIEPAIESFHDEDVRFGGAGITVVNFK